MPPSQELCSTGAWSERRRTVRPSASISTVNPLLGQLGIGHGVKIRVWKLETRAWCDGRKHFQVVNIWLLQKSTGNRASIIFLNSPMVIPLDLEQELAAYRLSIYREIALLVHTDFQQRLQLCLFALSLDSLLVFSSCFLSCECNIFRGDGR
jgi:hypothetical protein